MSDVPYPIPPIPPRRPPPVTPQGLPIPPIPVMPPEGIAPITQGVDTTGQDTLSPTTMVLNYLKQRGFTPSSENVRRALEANARDPGVISGLRSDTAGQDSGQDSAPSRAVSRAIDPGHVPPAPPSEGDQKTSAAPSTGDQSSNTDLGTLALSILGALPFAGAAAYGATKLPRPGPRISNLPNAPGGSAPIPPAAPEVYGPPELHGPPLPPAPVNTPLESALTRAAGPTATPTTPAPPVAPQPTPEELAAAGMGSPMRSPPRTPRATPRAMPRVLRLP